LGTVCTVTDNSGAIVPNSVEFKRQPHNLTPGLAANISIIGTLARKAAEEMPYFPTTTLPASPIEDRTIQ